MANYIVSDDASEDVFNIASYIAQDKPIAAERWLDRFGEKCVMLAEQPESGRRRPELDPDIRSSTIGNYVVFYRTIGEGIEVARVMHGSFDIESLDM